MLTLFTSLFLLTCQTTNPFPYGEIETKFELDGTYAGNSLGGNLAPAGDVNADGYADYLVAAVQADPNGVNAAGSVFVYSGKDHTILYQYDGQDAFEQLGLGLSGAGDVNNDGYDDILFGSINNGTGGTAYVHSGADGSLIYELQSLVAGEQFASSLAGIGDINGDGFDDVLVCAKFASPGGRALAGSAYIFTGKTGLLWSQIDGATAGDYLGTSCSAIDDVNQDGFPDFMISAAYADPNGLSNAGSAYVYSGKTNNVLYQYDGQTAGETLGYSLSAGGDFNGDGVDEFMIGSGSATIDGEWARGSAFIYSGTTGVLLSQFDGSFGSQFFGGISGVGDVNGDGVDDFTIWAANDTPTGLWNSGVLYLYSGATATVVHKWQGEAAWQYFGVSSAAGDVDKDGLDDLLIGSYAADKGGFDEAGTFMCVGLNPFLTSTASTISASSTSLTGFQLRFPAEAASYQYRVLFSVAGTGPFNFGVDIPLTLDPYALDSYFGNYPFPYASDMHGTLDANGFGIAAIGAPPGFLSVAIGATLHFAAIANAPGHLPEFSSVAVSIQITL